MNRTNWAENKLPVTEGDKVKKKQIPNTVKKTTRYLIYSKGK